MVQRLFGSQLAVNIGSGIASAILGALVMAVSYPLYLRFLGYEQFGVWLTMTTVLTVAQLGNLGIAPALTKLVAEEAARKNFPAVSQYVSAALAILLGTGCLMLLGMVAFRHAVLAGFGIDGTLAATAARLLPWVGALTILAFLTDALAAALSGLGRADAVNCLQAGGQIGGTVVSGVLLWAGWGLDSLLAGGLVSTGAAAVGIWTRINGLHRIELTWQIPTQRLRRLASFGGWVFATSLVNLLLNPLNKLLLAQFAGVAMLPLYEIAWNGSMRVRGFIEAGLRALLPEVTRLSANAAPGARRDIARLLGRSLRLAAAAGGPLFALGIVLAPVILHFWLGQHYQHALASAMRLLLAAAFISLLGVPSFYALMGLGLARANFRGSALLPLVNAGFIAIAYGLTGHITLEIICTGVVAGMLALNAFVMWQVRHALACERPGALLFKVQTT